MLFADMENNKLKVKRKDDKIMNKVILTGSVATSPRKVAEGIVIFNMVAIDSYNAKSKSNDTDLVPIKVMGKKADYVLENAEVGQQVEVDAKMSSRKSEDSKFFCDVVAKDIRLVHKSLKKGEEEVEVEVEAE